MGKYESFLKKHEFDKFVKEINKKSLCKPQIVLDCELVNDPEVLNFISNNWGYFTYISESILPYIISEGSTDMVVKFLSQFEKDELYSLIPNMVRSGRTDILNCLERDQEILIQIINTAIDNYDEEMAKKYIKSLEENQTLLTTLILNAYDKGMNTLVYQITEKFTTLKYSARLMLVIDIIIRPDTPKEIMRKFVSCKMDERTQEYVKNLLK
jgi:hypothetical protein